MGVTQPPCHATRGSSASPQGCGASLPAAGAFATSPRLLGALVSTKNIRSSASLLL